MLQMRDPIVVKVVSADADVFVLHNMPIKAGKFEWALNSVRRFFSEFAQLNRNKIHYVGQDGMQSINPDDILMHVVLPSEDLHSDDLIDHFNLTIDGKTYGGRISSRLLPYSILKGLCEGETKKLRFPVRMYNVDNEEEIITIVLELNLKAAQTKYACGENRHPFEEEVEKLIDFYNDSLKDLTETLENAPTIKLDELEEILK